MGMKRKKKKGLAFAVMAAVIAAGLIQPDFSVRAEENVDDVLPNQNGKLEILFQEPVSQGVLRNITNNGQYDPQFNEENNRWQQLTLPVGNSYMGMNIYGEIEKEHLTFNHKTLWTGGPSENRNYNGGNVETVDGIPMADYVKKVQEAFLKGDPSASLMCEKIIGSSDGYGAYQSWGDIYLDFDGYESAPENAEIVDDRDSAIQYDNSGWGDWSQSSWYGGTEKYNEKGGGFSFEFEGIGIQMIGAVNVQMGDYEAYIDDQLILTGSMYSAEKKENQILVDIKNLEDGKHVFRFQAVPDAEGRVKTSMDCLKILKATYEEVNLNPDNSADTGIIYTGPWGIYDRAAKPEADATTWLEAQEMYLEPGEEGSLEYSFDGTGIKLYGAQNIEYGTFAYSVDGGEEITVDTGAQEYTYQELLNVQGLEPGMHTIYIRSIEKKLSFDRIKVRKAEPQTITEHTETTNYKRALDVEQAISTVEYDRDYTHYYREYFASYPDNVMGIKLEAEGENKLAFDLSFPVDNSASDSKLKKTVTYTAEDDGTLTVAGNMNDNQMKLNAKIQVLTDEGGQVTPKGDELSIAGASEVVILLAADTDYKNQYPDYRTGETDEELAQSVSDVLLAAVSKGYDSVKENAVADYKEIYDRVNLNMGQASELPTTELLNAYNDNTATKEMKSYLEVLMFQYGRYLQIASSRAGDLPANLQGVWNNRTASVPWGSDYHMNVNLQMNYWPTYVTNMEECGIPLIDYVESLREPGRVTASTYFGIDNSNGQQNGFSAHTQNTPFGWTCPGWQFSWGWSPAAVPWILQNVYECYEYTQDIGYLKSTIFPMMQEEAKLYESVLTEVTDSDGTVRLATVPAYSPEHGPRTAGNTYENTLVWQLFNDCIEAGEVLNQEEPGFVSEETLKKWNEIKEQLNPIEIGESGQIKEWYDETTLGSVSGTQNKHRHLSHLLGLFPGDLINVDNAEYMDAAVVSLLDRGDDATGWGMGQRINAWARVGDGNHAYDIVRAFFKGGAYPNMWDSHPPFQIDGNFGYTAGVAEMLMQSNAGYINFLPAIPDDWQEGEVSGLVARGNFEVSENWSEGKLTNAEILSKSGGTCQVQYTDWKTLKVTDSSGLPVEVKETEENSGRFAFETTAGVKYSIVESSTQGQDKERLSVLIQTGDSILVEAEKYTDFSVKNLEEALASAKSTINNDLSGTEELNQAYKDLAEAITSMKYKGNKEELKVVMDKAADILTNAPKYLSSSVEGIQQSIDAAKAVYDNTDAQQTEIDDAIAHVLAECMEARLLGDIDENGLVDTEDSAAILKYEAEKTSFSDRQKQIGDINQDHQTDTADAYEILMQCSEK